MKTNLLGRQVRGLSFAAMLAAGPALASDTDRLRALRIDRADTPTVDGMLDDPAWRRAPAHESFHKHLPRDGEAVPQGLRTRVQLVVEDDALVSASAPGTPTRPACAACWRGATRWMSTRTSSASGSTRPGTAAPPSSCA